MQRKIHVCNPHWDINHGPSPGRTWSAFRAPAWVAHVSPSLLTSKIITRSGGLALLSVFCLLLCNASYCHESAYIRAATSNLITNIANAYSAINVAKHVILSEHPVCCLQNILAMHGTAVTVGYPWELATQQSWESKSGSWTVAPTRWHLKHTRHIWKDKTVSKPTATSFLHMLQQHSWSTHCTPTSIPLL